MEPGSGKNSVDTLERIAQFRGVSVDRLLRGDRRRPVGPRDEDHAVRLLRAVF